VSLRRERIEAGRSMAASCNPNGAVGSAQRQRVLADLELDYGAVPVSQPNEGPFAEGCR